MPQETLEEHVLKIKALAHQIMTGDAVCYLCGREITTDYDKMSFPDGTFAHVECYDPVQDNQPI